MTIGVDDTRREGKSSIVGSNISSVGGGGGDGEECFAVFFPAVCRRCRFAPGAGVGVDERERGRRECVSDFCRLVRRGFGLPVLVV